MVVMDVKMQQFASRPGVLQDGTDRSRRVETTKVISKDNQRLVEQPAGKSQETSISSPKKQGRRPFGRSKSRAAANVRVKRYQQLGRWWVGGFCKKE